MSASKCARCEQTVYPVEGLRCLDKIWHKGCFKCQECNMTLNLKNYKGFEKKPYCNAHCPQAKATTVADTPEIRRLAENTRIQSQAKYHEDFEKSKGKGFTTITDDPEMLRIKNTSKIISNVAYHGELERKKSMEEKRNSRGSEEPSPINDNNNKINVINNNNIGQPKSKQQTRPHMVMVPPAQEVVDYPPNHASQKNFITQSQYQQLQQQQIQKQKQQQLLLKQHQHQHYAQDLNGQQQQPQAASYNRHSQNLDGQNQQKRSSKPIQQPQQQPLMHPSQHHLQLQQQQQHQHMMMQQQLHQMQLIQQHRHSIDNSNMSSNRQLIKQSSNSSSNNHQQQQPIIKQIIQPQQHQMKFIQPAGDILGSQQSPVHLAHPQTHQQQQHLLAQQQHHTINGGQRISLPPNQALIQHNQMMPSFNQQIVSPISGLTTKQLHQQQFIQQHNPQQRHSQMISPAINPQQQQQLYHHHQQQRPLSGHIGGQPLHHQQIPLQAQIHGQIPRRAFRAIYDYVANDVDEVSFFENDVLVDCVNVDGNWLIGKVARSGQTGMLPANYVTELPGQ